MMNIGNDANIWFFYHKIYLHVFLVYVLIHSIHSIVVAIVTMSRSGNSSSAAPWLTWEQLKAPAGEDVMIFTHSKIQRVWDINVYIYILLYVCNAACMRACFFHVLILSYTSRYIKTYTLVFWFSTNYVWDFCVRMAPDESQVEVSGQTEDIFGYVTYASGFWPRTLHVCWITTLELPLQVTIPRFMTQKKWAQWLAKNILATPQKGIKCNFEMTLHRKASWFNETTTLPTYIHQSVSIGPMHHNRTKNISSPLLSTHYMLSMDTLGKTAETSKTPLQLLAPQHAL